MNNLLANQFSKKIKLELPINQLKSFLGEYNQHLGMIENALNVKIDNRGELFQISSHSNEGLNFALNIFHQLAEINQKSALNIGFLAKFLQENSPAAEKYQSSQIAIGNKTIRAKSANQARLIENLNQFAINFATGPAGCGKSWLSVAYALACFDAGVVEKIVLTRPVLEAGEKLGFLPGDLAQKIDPFLKPLYDALYEMYPYGTIDQLISSKRIEILPLAYMRGRTLNEAVVILDEAQNTTAIQMKMFLTRMGYNSKLIINGDLTQNDLPNRVQSGLSDAIEKLEHLNAIGFCQFDQSDIVRHHLVSEIVQCYENYSTRETKETKETKERDSSLDN